MFGDQRSEEGSAVEPSANLLAEKHPVQGTAEISKESPLPLGIRVRELEEGEAPRPLPLIFVPERAANSREVPMGWYLVAAIGSKFDIVVSNVHKKGEVHFRGEKLDNDRQCVVGDLSIEGKRAGYPLFKDPKTDEKAIYTGFTVQETERTILERPFRFVSVPTTKKSESTDIPEGMGTIELQILRYDITGEAKTSPRKPKNRTLKTLNPVNEEVAKKQGINVRVCGSEIKKRSITRRRTLKNLGNKKVMGSVKIYIRRKWWLQSRMICDEEGAVWVPSKKTNQASSNVDTVDLTQDSQDET